MYCIDSLINSDLCLKFSNISIVFIMLSFFDNQFNLSIVCPKNYTHSLSVRTSIPSNVAQVIALPECFNSLYGTCFIVVTSLHNILDKY